MLTKFMKMRNVAHGLFVLALLALVVSCKKDKSNNGTTPTVATPTQIGIYESDSSIYKGLFVAISKIGTASMDNGLLFDTGSGGLVIDASGILPTSMITSTGFNFTGDSTVVSGITITNQTSVVQYGNDAASLDKVYGNLAYADVVIGDQGTKLTVKRLPFFIYYKAIDAKGNKFPAHEFDVFGVSSEYDISFSNGAYITSPFASYSVGTGLTQGFKMPALGTSNFSLYGTYVPNAITIGLTSSDLASSSGFTQHQLTFYPGDGYAPVINTTITYGSSNKTTATYAIFDTGTEPYSYIEDKTATSSIALLPSNTPVSVSTTSGFIYSYTTTPTENLTYIENPNSTGATISIISLEYFLTGQYMLDYTNHRIGLKNN